eukprot:scaffold5540_cov96-Cylindrotheca_fusiformis.AAC.6
MMHLVHFVLLTFHFSLVLGDLASLYTIGSPTLSNDLELAELVLLAGKENDETIGLTYALSPQIQQQQIRVALYDYECDDILPDNSMAGFVVGNPIRLRSSNKNENRNEQAYWVLPLQVNPPSAFQKLSHSWYSFTRMLSLAVKKRDFSKLYNGTRIFYSNVIENLFVMTTGNGPTTDAATSLASSSACVRWMIYTPNSNGGGSSPAIEVTFDQTQVMVHFVENERGEMEISHVDLRAKQSPALSVSVGKNATNFAGETKRNDKEKQEEKEKQMSIENNERNQSNRRDSLSTNEGIKEGQASSCIQNNDVSQHHSNAAGADEHKDSAGRELPVAGEL